MYNNGLLTEQRTNEGFAHIRWWGMADPRLCVLRLRTSHADRLPVRHNGELDTYPLLGKIKPHQVKAPNPT